MCECVWGVGGWGGVINTRNSTSYDTRLSIYNDGVRPVEMKRRFRSRRETSVNRIYFDYAIN